MYIAGRERWRISIEEPQILRIALYLRDRYQLPVHTDPPIPALDPAITAWPVWVRRPELRPALELSSIERAAAALQWQRWWVHALADGDKAMTELSPPSLRQFGHLPVLRGLLARHRDEAIAWSTAFADDPRQKRDHLAPGKGLTAAVKEFEESAGRSARPFELRITVLSVQTKHAWILRPGHLLITHHLVRDDENMIDWLRPQLRPLV